MSLILAMNLFSTILLEIQTTRILLIFFTHAMVNARSRDFLRRVLQGDTTVGEQWTREFCAHFLVGAASSRLLGMSRRAGHRDKL